MFLSVLVLVFVPFLITWLLCGEFNVLGNDWFVAKNASVWHGYVTSGNIDLLADRYQNFYFGGREALYLKLQEYMDQDTMASINSYRTFFNPIVLAPLFGLLVWSFVYPIIFNATKISGLDVLPFSFSLGSFMIILIISGLIDQWGQQLIPVYWLTRLAIAAISTVAIFLLTNYFVNKFMAGREYAMDIYFGYSKLDKATALERQQLKENVDIFKKQKDNEESFVEVKEGE